MAHGFRISAACGAPGGGRRPGGWGFLTNSSRIVHQPDLFPDARRYCIWRKIADICRGQSERVHLDRQPHTQEQSSQVSHEVAQQVSDGIQFRHIPFVCFDPQQPPMR